MNRFAEIERLGRLLLEAISHGEPADSFIISTIVRIAHEAQTTAALETQP